MSNPPVVSFDFFAGGGVLDAALLAELLGGLEPDNLVNTDIVTVGDGALPAAALLGGQVTRTGPTAPFTDTTDTAADILAALGGNIDVAGTFVVRYKNATAFPATLAAGAGVTLPATVVVPALSAAWYFGTLGGTQAAPTVTLRHTATGPLHQTSLLGSTALTGTGAAVVTAAGIAGGFTARSGQSAAATDTSDTADAIIAAQPNLAIGQSFPWTYANNGAFPQTLGGGTGVTLAGTVPAHSWAQYLVKYTAADTVVMTPVAQGYFPKVGTFVANSTSAVVVTDSRVTATSVIKMGLNTLAGTPVGTPYESAARVVGTSFTVKAGSGDTSTYNYAIEG